MQYLSSVKNNQDVENIKQVAHTRPQVSVNRLRISFSNKRKCTIQELERPFTFPFWEGNSEPVSQLIATAVGATTTIRVCECFFSGDAEICARHAEVARETLNWKLPQKLPQDTYHGKIRTVAATPGLVTYVATHNGPSTPLWLQTKTLIVLSFCGLSCPYRMLFRVLTHSVEYKLEKVLYESCPTESYTPFQRRSLEEADAACARNEATHGHQML